MIGPFRQCIGLFPILEIEAYDLGESTGHCTVRTVRSTATFSSPWNLLFAF
jgi:hypothetical protein